MKAIIYIILFLLIVKLGYSQNTTTSKKGTLTISKPFDFCENTDENIQKPKYVNGDTALTNFLQKNISMQLVYDDKKRNDSITNSKNLNMDTTSLKMIEVNPIPLYTSVSSYDYSLNENYYVNIKFKISTDGTISEIQVLEAPNDAFINDAISVVQKMPKWIPAKKNNENISCYYCIKIPYNEATSNLIERINRR